MKLQFKKLNHYKGDLPKYETAGASGFDIRAQIDHVIVVKPLERVLVPAGFSVAVPMNYELQVRPRSGNAFKKGLTVLNAPGTIDADYRGEVKILLINLGQEELQIEPQDRIAQGVIAPVSIVTFEEVEVLSETNRGVGGFGSTGQ
jgi:dUTP pyrophosphatase